MNDQQSVAAKEPALHEIFRFPKGCRALLQRTMGDFIFQIIASRRPDAATILTALHGQTATVVAVTSEIFEMRLDQPITIGSLYEHVTFQLARSTDGVFRILLSSTGSPPLQWEASGLSVSRQEQAFVFADSESRVRVTPTSGGLKVEVYTAPFLKEQSAMVRAFAPVLVELFSLTAQ